MPPIVQYHVFSLPQDLLDTLTPRNLLTQTAPRSPSPSPSLAPTNNAGPGGRTCNICLATVFADVDEQRIHFRSDWHRYNVKMRLSDGNLVNESEFLRLVESLDDSLSGSASSSEDEDDSDDSDTVATLVNKRKKVDRSPSPTSAAPMAPQTALAWFHSPPSTQIGIYKAIFPTSLPPSSYLPELKEMQKREEDGRTWAMFMVAGGHFAGAIVRVQRPPEEEDAKPKKGKQKVPKPETEVLKHKTFHRYTTRRKQGGSQSANDKSKGHAISAGAQLRRYGEQALREDIRSLLTDWSEDINGCDRIWIRANVSNRRIFLDYEGATIAKGDDRLRTFPFPTRRPTQSELSRCILELTRVKVSRFTEQELREQDDAYLASIPKPRPQPTPATAPAPPEKEIQPRLTKEEEILQDKWTRAVEMISKGRLEALKVFWEREASTMGGVNAPIPEWTGERRGTLLQVAAHAGQENITRWLLEDVRADPTQDVPSSGFVEEDDGKGHESDASDTPRPIPSGSGGRRTAYDLARTRQVRNVFRRCAAAHPDWWDWLGAAHVPSALSKEMEEEREEKKKVRRKGLKDKVRERQAKEKEQEKHQPMPTVQEIQEVMPGDIMGPRKLGGATGAAQGVAGLTPEMRARVERERRARAAEARLKR